MDSERKAIALATTPVTGCTATRSPAAQATPAGGAVTVKTRTAGSTVELSVIDRGNGIASEHLESIFNPFFTTKSDGVGLGLAIVFKIVDEHGGTISVESEPGHGSTFRMFLPVGRPKLQV